MPPPTPRRRLPAAERRELLERAALALIAERGYHRTGIADIAAAAGVSVPVVYDHFESKAALHRRLLERTRDELLAMWHANLGGDGSVAEQVERAVGAWATYVHDHPFAAAAYFRETTGVEALQRFHAELLAQATHALAGLMGLLVQRPARELEMLAEILRGGLTELAIWWSRHPEVSHGEVVRVAMDAVWIGAERLSRGEGGTATSPSWRGSG